jgi:hypothetical protein
MSIPYNVDGEFLGFHNKPICAEISTKSVRIPPLLNVNPIPNMHRLW